MILTSHQPTYLSWCGLFDKVARADLFCVLDTVQYERRSWENRNQIKTNQGALMLSVPVESRGHFEKTGGTIRIIPDGWARKHVRSIELAYLKAPYFDEYYEEIRFILMRGHEFLVDLNMDLLHFFLKWLGIKTRVVRASGYEFQGEKSGLVLDMCQKLGATRYIFGSQGRSYADVDAFNRAGIEVEFQDYHHPEYPQLHGPFLPNMSALDILFNCGHDSLKVLTNATAPVR